VLPTVLISGEDRTKLLAPILIALDRFGVLARIRTGMLRRTRCLPHHQWTPSRMPDVFDGWWTGLPRLAASRGVVGVVTEMADNLAVCGRGGSRPDRT
jgi:hypothetical protein